MADLNIGQRENITLEAMKEVGKEEQQELRAEQQESQSAFVAEQKETTPAFVRTKTDKTLKSQSQRVRKNTKLGEKSDNLLPIQRIKDSAEQFERRNPELKANILALLREAIKPGDDKETILKKLLEFYPDVSLADEALEFLLETTDGELHRTIAEAKEEFNTQFSREISAGRNIGAQARSAAEKGLGTTTSLRDMYRDITGNPRDSTTLFEQLAQKYAFKDLKKVIDFLLHSLGADLKSKGPSIPPGLLHRLLTETRSLQAILGVYRFFRGRMHLVQTMFQRENMAVPQEVTFESLSKEFMTLAAERYPAASKVLQLAQKLGVDASVIGKIILFSQYRDAIREVAMQQIYKSVQHRDELFMAIIEALEDLEDQLEELQEKDEDEDEDDEEGEEDEDK
jgi:type III secretion protein W